MTIQTLEFAIDYLSAIEEGHDRTFTRSRLARMSKSRQYRFHWRPLPLDMLVEQFEEKLNKPTVLPPNRRASNMDKYRTDMYEGMIAETVTVPGHNATIINAYFARPLGSGPFPGVVLIHHAPGWDEWYRETTRRFAHRGYLAISPNIYYQFGHGAPEDIAAKARAAGGIPDDDVVGNITESLGYLKSLPQSNGKAGVFGTCSGGRQAFLVACRTKGFDAVVDCC